MLIDFLLHLKSRKLPVYTAEFLTLLEAVEAGLAHYSIDNFYVLARTCLIKNEANYDKFDVAFEEYFRDLESLPELEVEELPPNWLALMGSPQDTASVLNGIKPEDAEKLLEEFKQRLAMQRAKNTETQDEEIEDEAGNKHKLPGLGGNGERGNAGSNPDGARNDQDSPNKPSKVKGWKKRDFKGFDETTELGIRNIRVALKRLRQFAREGAEVELDLDATIAGTSRNAGWLDIRMRPERHNKVKVLIFFDIGGSMDAHVKLCEELFSAMRSEFKHLEFFYFHNCVYDTVWRSNKRMNADAMQLFDVMHKYGDDYKVILVGDAAMWPDEILKQYGCVEYANEEPGQVWMERLLNNYKSAIWLNPEPDTYWHLTRTTVIMQELMGQRMYPLTVQGIEQAMRRLNA